MYPKKQISERSEVTWIFSKSLKPVHLFLALILFCTFPTSVGKAESAIELLSGFDQERLEKTFPPTNPDSLSELCKLVYRLRGVNERKLEQLAQNSPAKDPGDAIRQTGDLVNLNRVEVPARLQEYLGFDSVYFLQVKANNEAFRIITSRIPKNAKPGDQIRVTGVLLTPKIGSETATIASGTVGWFAKRDMSEGERLLEEKHFNLTLLAGLADRNRLPLMPQDGDAFYSMLNSAHQLTDQQALPKAKRADPVTFLRDGTDTIAEWVRMEIEGVQITRVAVTNPQRQNQLGSDHYYQVDAIGDLGAVVVKVERDDGKEPVEFKTRYPVSIAIRELPEFLRSEISKESQFDGAIVRPLRGKLAVTGFFFRLWSYQSEFMQQKGGTNQFGPLLIASSIENLEPAGHQSIGVERIGSAAALVIISSILGIWFWLRKTGLEDLEAKKKRKDQQATTMDLQSHRVEE